MATTCGLCDPLTPFSKEVDPAMLNQVTNDEVAEVTKLVAPSFEESCGRGSVLQAIPEDSNEENNEESGVKAKDAPLGLKDSNVSTPVLGEKNVQEPVSSEKKTNDKDNEEDSTAKESLVAEVAVDVSPEKPTEEIKEKEEPLGPISFEELTSPDVFDYDEGPSQLYNHLQKKDWGAVLERLKVAPGEAKIWISRKELDGKLRWRLLPIHGAIVFKAPENLIQSLLTAYPDGARSKDDQGMLPIHLSYKIGSSEGAVRCILAAFPGALNIEDRKGRVPQALAEKSTGPNKEGFLRALKDFAAPVASESTAPVVNVAPAPECIPRDALSMTSTIPSVVTAGAAAIASTAAAIKVASGEFLSSDEELEQDAHPLVSKSKDREWKEVVDTIGDYVDKADLQDEVNRLEKEVEKSKETSTVLSEHVASLESQINTRSNTERFLATKIATLDTSLKLVTKSKEEIESGLRSENNLLAKKNEALELKVTELLGKMEDTGKEEEEARNERVKNLEAEAAEYRTKLAQLEEKASKDQSMESEVASLNDKLKSMTEDNKRVVLAFSTRVRSLESKQDELRETISQLVQRMHSVSSVKGNQEEMTKAVNEMVAGIAQRDEALSEEEFIDHVVSQVCGKSDEANEKPEEGQPTLP